MLFNSFPFLGIFFPIVFAGFFLIGHFHSRAAALWLALASITFYGLWNVDYVPLLLASVLWNYSLGRLIVSAPRELAGRQLFLAVAGNLALLAYYKYANFFLENVAAATGANWEWTRIVLPLGISFFTFTQIAFLVDCRRGQVKNIDFLDYLLFVTYFPHLIAGPILHHAQMTPQFARKEIYRLDWTNIAMGLTIFTLGLSKKVLLADTYGDYARGLFEATQYGYNPMFFDAWFGALAYTLQLYFDFSGYCDMAIGLSLFFNIRLPVNFNSPYQATSIIDFWRRWHMTLSAFLRDYLYIPLGGNRHGPVRRYLNLMLTMLLGGIWHGAGWTFLVWGALHGTYLLINHAWRSFSTHLWPDRADTAPPLLTRCFFTGLTFLAVLCAWVVFRSESLASAGRIYAGMLGLNGVSLFNGAEHYLSPAFLHYWHIQIHGLIPLRADLRAAWVLLFCGTGLAAVFFLPNSQYLAAYSPNNFSPNSAFTQPFLDSTFFRFVAPAYIGLILGASCISMITAGSLEFLYFNF